MTAVEVLRTCEHLSKLFLPRERTMSLIYRPPLFPNLLLLCLFHENYHHRCLQISIYGKIFTSHVLRNDSGDKRSMYKTVCMKS